MGDMVQTNGGSDLNQKNSFGQSLLSGPSSSNNGSLLGPLSSVFDTGSLSSKPNNAGIAANESLFGSATGSNGMSSSLNSSIFSGKQPTVGQSTVDASFGQFKSTANKPFISSNATAPVSQSNPNSTLAGSIFAGLGGPQSSANSGHNIPMSGTTSSLFGVNPSGNIGNSAPQNSLAFPSGHGTNNTTQQKQSSSTSGNLIDLGF